MSAAVLLIAAPSSGSGKTTITAGLAWLYRRQGKRVKVFKCGPDFLDPLLLGFASGSPVDNLDLWLVGEDLCRQMLAEAARDYDVVLIESVMGLFDGEPSTADLAVKFGLPVLAVIDAGAMAQTFGALAFGLAHYRADLPFYGVLANKVAGERHAQMLQEACPAAQWQGWVGRGEPLPERHLGIVQPHEVADLPARLDQLAEMLASQPIAQLPAPTALSAPAAAPIPPLLAGRRIAVAQDAAFCFIYPANLACLRALGAEVVTFSPLAHEALPACDAVWLPGGYPELHAPALAAHPSIAAELAAHLAAGRPIWAECGGMLALAEALTLSDGQVQPMWGLLPAQGQMQTRLAALGAQQIDLGAGALRGHTFHYSTLQTTLTPEGYATPCRLGSSGEAVYRHGYLRASYLHVWFAANPVATAALFGVQV
ncbi:cobyrinate a,c-diamide synthase [Chitinibacter tainanensis]|uniref:cobyrinate a,c-diamide synthase n=1 Tax=Chitinibacter tainanensis TaxID=230667 RepID=UPI0023566E74|nr:cobyrinate a,c-diamide synthase [Chitinibacter tainanensis]